MKNLKKVLALVIVFAMMMSSAAFAGVTFPDVADDASYASAISTLASLGFFKGDDNGNFNPDATITRAEYATILCRIVGEDNATGTADFADVPATHWATGYINVASQRGLIKGYGDGNFGPDDKVKYEDAVTMIIRALGYEPLAVSKGGYPSGYLTVGSQYGLLAGANGTQGTDATRATVAVLTYNALDIPVVEQTGFGTDVQYTIMKKTDDQDKVTLLTRLGMYKLGGIVVSNEKVSYTGSATEIGMVEMVINDDFDNPVKDLSFDAKLTEGQTKLFRDEAAITEDMIAINAVVYVQEYASSKYDVVAIEAEDGLTDTLVIDAADIDEDESDFTNNAVRYYKDGASRTTKITLDETYAVVINNTVILASDFTAFVTAFENGKIGGNVEFIDWDNNNKYDVVKFTMYDHYIAKSVATNSGKISTYNNRTINLNIEDDEAIVSVKDVKGNAVNFEDIKEYDVLAVMATPFSFSGNASLLTNGTYDSLEVIVLADSKVTGTLKGKSTDVNDATILKVDDTNYELAEKDLYDIDANIALGSEGDFFIGINGKIIGFNGSIATGGEYGFIVSAYAQTNGTVANMDVITKEGKLETLDYASKVKITNAGTEEYARLSFTSKLDDDEKADFENVVADSAWADMDISTENNVKDLLLAEFNLNNYEKPADANKRDEAVKRFIKYKTNAAGEISEIFLADDNKANETFGYANVDAEYNAPNEKLGSYYLDEAVVVFDVDFKDLESTTVKDMSLFVDEDEYEGVIYDQNSNGFYGALLLTSSDADFAIGSALAAVLSVEEGIDADDQTIYNVTVAVNGEEKELVFYDDLDVTEVAFGSNADLDFGSIIMYNASADGIVSKYATVATVDYTTGATTFKFDNSFAAEFEVNDDSSYDDTFYIVSLENIQGKSYEFNILDRISSYDENQIVLNSTWLANAQQYTYSKSGKTKTLDMGDAIGNLYEPDAEAGTGYVALIRLCDDNPQEIFVFEDEVVLAAPVLTDVVEDDTVSLTEIEIEL